MELALRNSVANTMDPVCWVALAYIPRELLPWLKKSDSVPPPAWSSDILCKKRSFCLYTTIGL